MEYGFSSFWQQSGGGSERSGLESLFVSALCLHFAGLFASLFLSLPTTSIYAAAAVIVELIRFLTFPYQPTKLLLFLLVPIKYIEVSVTPLLSAIIARISAFIIPPRISIRRALLTYSPGWWWFPFEPSHQHRPSSHSHDEGRGREWYAFSWDISILCVCV